MDDKIAEMNKDNKSDDNADEPKITGCPQFWILAMGHNEAISETILEDDVDALEYLYDITCEVSEARRIKLKQEK